MHIAMQVVTSLSISSLTDWLICQSTLPASDKQPVFMMTSSNGTFSALLAICAWNSRVPSEFSAQRPMTRSFGVFFNLRLNKRLSKQSWCWRFKTPLRPLWRHCNERHVSQTWIILIPASMNIYIHYKCGKKWLIIHRWSLGIDK